MRPTRTILAVLLVLSALTVGCGLQPKTFDVATRPVSIVRPAAASARPVTLAERLHRLTPTQRARVFRWWRLLAIRAYLDAVWHAVYDIPADLRPVVACIYSAESGIFDEHSHPLAGSGAAQWTPSTWRAWLARWRTAVGYTGPDYRYAYQAPRLIQEAVLWWTLRNGGSQNWSNRYGYDPCTSGMA